MSKTTIKTTMNKASALRTGQRILLDSEKGASVVLLTDVSVGKKSVSFEGLDGRIEVSGSLDLSDEIGVL